MPPHIQRPIIRRSPLTNKDTFPEDWPDILKRVYANRGIASHKEVEYSLAALLPAHQLKGIDAAVKLLHQHLTKQNQILIIGDFDADGATSTAVAVRGLKLLGAKRVDFLVPNRFKDGYGLTPSIVDAALPLAPQLLITVDNGITSIEGVSHAKAHGLDVLITDHHLPGQNLPAADAIVNPNQPGDDFTSKSLAGVGVMFYVLLALRAYLREQQWFAQIGLHEPKLAQLLDLVALGTVADVASLDHNNRILVHQGLRRIRAGQACPGIQALIENSGRIAARIHASDLGFALGPRLNAAGRLDDMSLGIACLLTDDIAKARHIATQLNTLNDERREIEWQMQQEAWESLQAQLHLKERLNCFSLCLYQKEWHQGIVGLLASRVKDHFYRPTLVFADAGNGLLKGSGRSIPGLHLRDAIERVHTLNPGLIEKFGGHAMAAGITLAQSHFQIFANAFEAVAKELLQEATLIETLLSDGELHNDEMTLPVAEALQGGGPWGQHFPEPVFDGFFIVQNTRSLLDKHLKMQVQPQGSTRILPAIWFNSTIQSLPAKATIAMAYRLDVNHYQDLKQIQLVVEQAEVV